MQFGSTLAFLHAVVVYPANLLTLLPASGTLLDSEWEIIYGIEGQMGDVKMKASAVVCMIVYNLRTD